MPLIEGNWAYLASAFEHVILPGMALALGIFGVVVRVLRSSMLDVMRANYIRTARAKGLKERTVFFKHGLRNAMISVITLSSLIVTWLITGTIFVENMFRTGNGSVCFHSAHRARLPRDPGNNDSFCDNHHFVKSHGRHPLCDSRPPD